jgi:HEAT repeat protein
MLNDKDYCVRMIVSQALPKILDLFEEKDVQKVCDLLQSNALRKKSDIRSTACECLGLLAPKLHRRQLTKVKDLLIIKLDDEDWNTRIEAFRSLSKMAHRFSDEELTSLINILVDKADQHTYKYIRAITHLIKKSQYVLLKTPFDDLESRDDTIRSGACLILSSLASYVSKNITEQIISKFIFILENKRADLGAQTQTAALNGLILLADFIMLDERQQILSLPPSNFDVIAGKYILESYFALHQLTLPQNLKM